MKTVCFHKRTSVCFSVPGHSVPFLFQDAVGKATQVASLYNRKKKHLFFFNRYLYMYNCVSVEPRLYNKKNTFFIMLKGFLFS